MGGVRDGKMNLAEDKFFLIARLSSIGFMSFRVLV